MTNFDDYVKIFDGIIEELSIDTFGQEYQKYKEIDILNDKTL